MVWNALRAIRQREPYHAVFRESDPSVQSDRLLRRPQCRDPVSLSSSLVKRRQGHCGAEPPVSVNRQGRYASDHGCTGAREQRRRRRRLTVEPCEKMPPPPLRADTHGRVHLEPG